MISRDLHVHLYGCLTAEDLWDIGKDRYKSHAPLLEWYSSEYEKAWGRRPCPQDYWEREGGEELLKRDYLFVRPGNFSRFQACFNLIIALCSISPDDFSIQEQIIRKVAESGLEYFEARTLIPFKFSDQEVRTYLGGLCPLIRRLNQELGMETKLVFSLFRDNSLAMRHYRLLREYLNACPGDGSVISGIDFAFAEEGHPPSGKKDLFRQFHADNQRHQKLDLLYHVGESFGDKGLESAVRWVWEAWELGCTRLGHAIALGVDPENYLGSVVYEKAGGRLDTIGWLLENESLLARYGFQADTTDLRQEQSRLQASGEDTRIVYDRAYCDKVRSLQSAAAAILKEKNVVIESCPTSNLRIGQVRDEKWHPLKFFHRMGLNYKVATDDPGVFNTDWVSEDALAKRIISAPVS